MSQQLQEQPPPVILQQYRKLVADVQATRRQVSDLEMNRNEHLLVEETLKPLDPQRRAFRLVGECLVERTVGEVLPTVSANREQMENTIKALKERLELLQTQTAEIKAKYNLQDAGR